MLLLLSFLAPTHQMLTHQRTLYEITEISLKFVQSQLKSNDLTQAK